MVKTAIANDRMKRKRLCAAIQARKESVERERFGLGDGFEVDGDVDAEAEVDPSEDEEDCVTGSISCPFC